MAHDHPLPPVEPVDDGQPSRRTLLGFTSTVGMIAGLVGGYGLFSWLGVRFMLPARIGQVHQFFVARVSDMAEGASLLYRTPSGVPVNITRRAATGTADDFIALSSTCPHLGCQVRWEEQNGRYFCPCHNGTFDPSGKATGGPPGDAGQSLPRYGLTVQKGLLYIDIPDEQLTVPMEAGVVRQTRPQGPGHDPCLGRLEPVADRRQEDL
jgi:nitrite reductase/ring-hydroxylating ferredoxin subunit